MSTSMIECALSGATPSPDAIDEAATFREGPEGLPEDWTEIRVTRRRVNPAWEVIQEAKDLTVEQLLSQVDPKVRDEIENAVVMQIEAQFAALENRHEYRQTVIDVQTVYLAPATVAEGMDAAIKTLCSMLGLDEKLILPEPEEPEDEPDDEPGAEPDPSQAG